MAHYPLLELSRAISGRGEYRRRRVALIQAWNWVLQYSICRGGAVFPFQRLLSFTAHPDHSSIAHRGLQDSAKRSLLRGQRVRKRENSRVSASRSVAFDRSIANTLVYTGLRASIIFIAAVLSRILHFYRHAIFPPCLRLILLRYTQLCFNLINLPRHISAEDTFKNNRS